MSSLGAQLVALNAPGKNVGSNLPSSKRHEDAIGRGITHSVTVGHSVSTKSHLHKASIIYEDSKKASDVPLTTVRENCIASLRQLEALDPAFGGFVDSLCNPNAQERALLTPSDNEKTDKLVEDVLFRLSLHMNSRKTVTSCLHVVEYLLRRYDIHVRPKTAATALLVMLPHHENPFFLRLLQLIDLASMPAWAFLRPYAAPGARLGRQVLSKQASKDTAFVREICRLAHRNAKLQNCSQSLSFTAAVIVEAITLQTRQTGSINEQTCQSILPLVVSACKQSKSEAYQNWGYVVSSTIIENSVLAEEPRQVLVTSILQGLGDASEMVVLNGLVVVLTILAQPVDGLDSSARLPMIGSPSTPLGHTMDKSTFQAMLKIDGLAARLGQLYSDEGIADVAHWVASVLVLGWNRLLKKKDDKKHESVRQFVLDMIKEPKLKTFWKNHGAKCVASFTSYVISSFDPATKEKEGEEDLKLILEALRRVSAVAYDEGMAHALIRTKKEKRMQLAASLGLEIPDAAGDSESAEQQSFVLPPRVALEHADTHVRLAAIPRVVEEYEGNDEPMDDDGESLHQALLRRLTVDDDSEVALAAGEALCRLLQEKTFTMDHDFGDLALQSLHRWTDSTILDKNMRESSLALSLTIVSHVARGVADNENMIDLFVLLVEGLGAHLTGTGEIALVAAKGICFALDGKTIKKEEKKCAQSLLVSNEAVIQALRRTSWKAKRAEQALRRRFMAAILEAWTDSLQRGGSSEGAIGDLVRFSSDAVDYCTWVLDFKSTDLSQAELHLIAACLTQSAKHVTTKQETLPDYIRSFAVHSGDIFNKAAAPFIQTLCNNVKDSDGNPASSIAILMEAALVSTSGNAVGNLLSLALKKVLSASDVEASYGFAPALALLGHSEEGVRRKAVKLISVIGDAVNKEPESEWKALREVSLHVSKNKSSATMGGSSFLSTCMASAIQESKHATQLQKCLLKLCVFAAAGCASLKATSLEEAFSKSWLPLGQVSGGYFTAATVMNAAELAGEDAFPLLLRWKSCGKAIFDGLMQSGVAVESISESLTILIDSTVRMLKGVTVVDSSALHDSMPKIIISTGPASRGGRTRSYSIGKSDGVRFLDPYPKDMQNALTTILSVEKDSIVSRRIIETVLHTVLSRQSWGEGVFKHIPLTVRQKIVKALMRIATLNLADNTEEALFALPMEATGVTALFAEEGKATGEVASVTFLADYVNANARSLLESAKVTGLISTMFQLLSSLSSKTVEGSDELDFARQSILTAQVQLIKGIEEADGKTMKVNFSTEHKFLDWMSLLVDLLGGEANESASIRPLVSFRARGAALTLLTTLCSEYPSSAAKFLIPALSAAMTNSSSEREARAASESFAAIVAAYCKHMSPSSLSLANLFNAFVELARKNEDADTRLKFYQSFVDALAHSPASQSEGYSVVGALAASSLAAEVNATTQSQKKSAKTSPASNLASKILQFTPVSTQVAAMMTLVNYAKELMAKLSESGGSSSSVKSMSLGDLELIAFDGPTSDMKKLAKRKPSGKSYSKQQRQTIMKLCTLMMISVSDALATAPFRKFIKNSERDTSGLSLRLWQDLLLVQATCFNNSSGKATGEEDSFWEAAGEATKECLDNLQNSLPSNIFLAFATTLIKEGGTEELRSRAVRLVADRVLTVEPSSPEAGLFRDIIPFLVRLLDSPGASSMDDGEDYGTLLQQSVLVAVENIARALCLHPGAKPASHSQVFTSAVMKCSGILVKASEPLEKLNSTFSDIGSSSRQLICSAALCAATTVRVCGPRCLPTLPKLMKALGSSLSAANSYLGTASGSVDDADESRNQARMMQLSVLRSLIAVADTLPQFLVPYLNVILAPGALPSSYLRTDKSDQEITIQAAAARMDAIVSSRVPARQLIPATSHAMLAATGTGGIRALLSILKASVQTSSGNELAAQRGNLLKAATFAFEYEGHDDDDGDRYSLFAAANELLLALILKLSEVQLRPLYAKLREWRGDLDKADPEALASRRFAFWSLSACLGKELRSIFLPCLGTVFADVIDELELAAAQLCKADAAKKISGGKKKRRLTEDMNVAYSAESLKPLQPLLLCLEAAFRADAHDGGHWIRADDAQRYNLLLEPLGKLLQCHQTPATEKSYSFASLVMGADNDTGSVVSALVALAGAAGDESLWKPLNHCVLEACSNEHRSEVRKAGVSCLLSLVKSLGEEYMVLLPECLPVVSELLEDQDEEVAGLAQDCVTLSEELLGESLQDSLR
jgi:hypothetical protein